MERPTILVVDDDPSVREVLRQGFEAEGWIVCEASSRAAALDALAARDIDLLVLDLALGPDDGLALAQEIRAVRNLPILILTGRGAPFDRLRGLESGADDYVVKPFHVQEVVLRLRRILATYNTRAEGTDPIPFDHGTFHPTRRVVTRLDGATVELTDIELRLLDLLIRHPGRILSRDDISRALYGRDWSPYDRTIDGHVARLRRKVEPGGEAPSLIRSVRGIGYVFAGEVHDEGESGQVHA